MTHTAFILDLTTCVSCGLPHRGSALCSPCTAAYRRMEDTHMQGRCRACKQHTNLYLAEGQEEYVLLCLADSIRASVTPNEGGGNDQH